MRAISAGLALAILTTGAALAQAPPIPPNLFPRGLVTKEPGVSPGYVLFAPIPSGTIYLVDNDGQVVHLWETPFSGPGDYLLENGNLLRSARDPEAVHFRAGGVSGMIQELAWDGTVVWEFELSDAERILHHDIEPLPNGNVLAIGWESKTREEAIAAGRRPDTVGSKGLHPDFVVEVQPIRPRGGKIVWAWHVWDHLVQDHDAKAPGYGDPAAHPERLDLNALAQAPEVSAEELAQLQALGYVPDDAAPEDLAADFLHINGIDYHAGLDQFALSVPELGEVWIIDHSTTLEEAAGTTGGRAGRGGDLLYRWGNPGTYGRGGDSPARLFFQHDARWVPEDDPTATQMMIFNNGRNRPEGPWSTVEVIALPVDAEGRYPLAEGEAWGPKDLTWSWKLPEDRFAPFISGSQRLPNGNTLACSGPGGVFLEVNPEGEIVWEYRNPFTGSVQLADGSPPQPTGDKAPFAVFRATRIPPDHPGLAGKKLVPLSPQPKWAEGAGAASP